MFCPKCKAEYREGFTVCAECGVPLVEKLPEQPEFDPVFLIETEEDNAAELPELLRLAGVHCYIYGGDGVFVRMVPEYPIASALYVDSRDLPLARKCLGLLSGPPIPVDEDDLIEAFKESMAAEEPEPEIDPEREATGDGAWKVFLILAMIVIAFLISRFFQK